MNLVSSILRIIKILALLVVVAQPDSWTDDVVEKFYWTPSNDDRNIQWEFFIIGKRVTWNVGKILCSSRDSAGRSTNDESIEDTLSRKNLTRTRRNVKINSHSELAILERDDARLWLSRMLSESNYRYDGLWIGGHRRDSSSNWTWLGAEGQEEVAIASSSIVTNYPEWYRIDDKIQENSRNCLIFERIGHDLPLLVPTNCQLKKPFVCSRIVTKKIPETIVEGTSVIVDGYRYTIFSVDEGEQMDSDNTSGVRRLNGGGIKWIDARLECRKRGQYLAMVMSNEAAKKIASIMLKNRPSMESAWLGGWSTDGTDWTWSTTGFVLLSSRQSSTSQYPPWLAGHPIANSKIDDYYHRHGRCLILDRHLCPDHISPVFLDVDCEKKRPFVCQDDIPGRRSDPENSGGSMNRRISVGNRILEFSTDRLTWNEGQTYCVNKHGRIASILDSKTLSTVLDRMTDLHLDHVWVGGRTRKTNEGWRWMDETGKALSRRGIGIRVSWCLGDDESTFPKVDPDNCLNLDREGHGLPLFYGLPCNFTRQHVLCSFESASRILESSVRGEKKNLSLKLEEVNFASSDLQSFGSITTSDRGAENGEEWENYNDQRFGKLFQVDLSNRDILNSTTSSSGSAINDSRDDTNEFRFFKTDGANAINDSEKKIPTKRGTRLADLDEKTKELLAASGYNISDSDLILGLELELVDIIDNSTVNGINETSSASSRQT